MELIKSTLSIDFLGKRRIWFAFSVLLISASAYLWFSTGENKYGVDYRGGTELVVRFKDPIDPHVVRSAFESTGFTEVVVQAFHGSAIEATSRTDFSIRLPAEANSGEGKEKVQSTLKGVSASGFELLKEDFVGPIIGEQIRRDAIISVFLSLLAIMGYVAARFEWRYGIGGILALFHDCIVTVGFCLLTHRQMSAGILAALLTIVGYSINDTIIIYDRIRENIAKAIKGGLRQPNGKPFPTRLVEIMNLSVNETLGRTILTSLTAFFVCTTLWLFGGGALSDLAFTLMVGIVCGTYSTVFIACPIVLALHPANSEVEKA